MSTSKGYWLIRDDTPMAAQRVKGYDGSPNPVCFNCEHRYNEHRHDDTTTFGGPLNSNDVKRNGGPIDCLYDGQGCVCKYFIPSFVMDDEDHFSSGEYVSIHTSGQEVVINAPDVINTISTAQPSFTCPECHMTSWHPMDVKEKYCGRCRKFFKVFGANP